MKLAIFTPLAPVKSGIADYSQALLPHLAEHLDITVFTDGGYAPDGFPAAPQISIRGCSEYVPQEFDETLYQFGNNPHHVYIYDAALRHPGINLLHEYNLHHLVAAATIKRGDWDGYLREVEYEAGPEALAYAARARKLEVGPDYDNVALSRRVIESAKATIVHSDFMVRRVRAAGAAHPVKRIPHGAWIPEVNRNRYRAKLGVEPETPLIGIFGFLKPYKRIRESLRAMRRLVRLEPRARMILVGEEHEDFPVKAAIDSLGLGGCAQVLGYVPADEFEQYIGAVDICLNLRYPTAGETSGTLLRALGLGRAVIVSDVGAFADLPAGTCLKVPVGEAEIDLLTEYLNLLVTRPEAARGLGARARNYAAAECSWPRAAKELADWIADKNRRGEPETGGGSAAVKTRQPPESKQKSDREPAPRQPQPEPAASPTLNAAEAQGRITKRQPQPEPAASPTLNAAEAQGRITKRQPQPEPAASPTLNAAEAQGRITRRQPQPEPAASPTLNAAEAQGRITKRQPQPEPAASPTADDGLAEYIRSWNRDRGGDAAYVEAHLTRLVRTLQITPAGTAGDRILEMGAYMHITPALAAKLGYGEVRGSYLGPPGKTDVREVAGACGERFRCEIDLFNAERDAYPYADGSFAAVLCCELIEHLYDDPMHLMAEVNRILRPGGHLVLSTPNACSYRAAAAVLLNYHPGFFHQYVRPDANGVVDPRHAREFAPRDVHCLLEAGGFEVVHFETGPYLERKSDEYEWVKHVMERYELPQQWRDDAIYAVGRKSGPIRERYPQALYAGGAA